MAVILRILFSVAVIFIAFLSSSQERQSGLSAREYELADKFYNDAEKLTSTAHRDTSAANEEQLLNKRSLEIFNRIIRNHNGGVSDSLMFHSLVKAGSLYHGFDSLPQAKNYYLHALQLRNKLSHMQDSFFFKPMLYAGSVYYSLNAFDSAMFYYKKAEDITTKYARQPEEAQRLYNTMGAINYAMGNYRTAQITFKS
jgi:tetratricopeptide (TPR) repeat protein